MLFFQRILSTLILQDSGSQKGHVNQQMIMVYHSKSCLVQETTSSIAVMIARNTNLSYVYDTRGYVVVTCRIIDLSLMLQKFQWVVIYFPIALHEPCKFFFEGKCIRLITILIEHCQHLAGVFEI